MAARRRPNPQQIVRSGPWKGVRDVGDSGMQSPEFAIDCINGHFKDPVNGGAIYARGGFERATGSALDGGSVDVPKAVHTIVAADGTQRTFALVGTKVFREGASDTWTDVTPSGVTISSNTEMYMTSYNDELIVSDGVNEPWRGTDLGATPIVGTEIEINSAGSAWAARGAPAVYGGKLFFIVAAIASTSYNNRIVWSEELDASTGYLQTGFTNFWDLVQTSSERIVQLAASNSALFYFRHNSIGAISGAVNATFSTTSTHDSVSLEEGCYAAPLGHCAPIVACGHVWFLNQRGLPVRFAVGSSNMDRLWLQLRGRVERIQIHTTLTSVGLGSIAYDPRTNKVVMVCLRDHGSGFDTAYAKNLYVFDGHTGNYEGRWMVELASQPVLPVLLTPTAHTDTNATAVGISIVASARDRILGEQILWIGGRRTDGTAGHLWRRVITPSSLGDNSAAMHFAVVTHLVPDEQNVEIKVDEVALNVAPENVAVSLDYYTPYGSSTGISATGTAASDEWAQGSTAIAYSHGIVRWGLGQNATGRWFRSVFHRNVAFGSTQHAFEHASYKVRTSKAGPLSP